MEFVHLHVHSHYSLLDGLSKVDDLIARAQQLGMKSIALTDHGVMYGAIEFYQKAQAAGIKPIIGVEAYVAHASRADKVSRTEERPYHLVLLAQNEIGYRNLISLTTRAHLEGYYYKPRIDFDLLAQHHDGLIALTACMAGELPKHILSGKLDLAETMIRQYQNLFGPDNFYLEVQHHLNVADQARVNQAIFDLSERLKVPVVATNDSHYLTPEDAAAHDILLCIQTKHKLSDQNRMTYKDFDVSLRTAEEMASDFADHPEAITNSVKIAERCNLSIELGKITLPYFEVPLGQTTESYLKALCHRGLLSRYDIQDPAHPKDDLERKVIDRLDYELSVILKTGFASYFLIVQDFINWAKQNKIVVGPGRGSAAGSIVSYLTNITNLDPLKYELLFERFLNPERISMPDIDIDFADDRRDEVIRYVESKYGKDHVAQIITFGTMAARAAIRDVGRVLGLSYSYCDRVAKLIPMFTTLTEAIASIPELREIYAHDAEGRNLLDTAKKLEGVARHASVHACGVVITKESLDHYVPVQHAAQDDATIVTQYSLHPIEDLGLLKMDFLGLKNLTILQNTINIIEKIRQQQIDLDSIPLDDPATFRLLQQAKTTGVFQLESSGMKRYLKQLQPNDLEDIIAMVSLYRPGPMEFIPDFIAGKHGLKRTVYLHPKLQPILEKTYGVAVYQEQIMQIAQALAGFTLGEADVLRKAVGKKIAKLLAEQRNKFIDGCVNNDIPKSTAEKVFDFIEPFARYGFNRSHGACYALIAYQTAYFKANYPAEFMAALLTSDQENIDRIAIEIDECRKMNIQVLPPDINESFSTFTVVAEKTLAGQPTIRFGLCAVKNVGTNIVNTIITERKANGPFQTLEDFLTRVKSKDLNKKSMESLIKAGAMERYGERNQLLANLETLLAYAKSADRASSNGQINIFHLAPVDHRPALRLRTAQPASQLDCLTWEKQLLGLYITAHPFSEYAEVVKDRVTPIANLLSCAGSDTVIIAGMVTGLKKILTKSHETMFFAKIEDSTGAVEVLVFPKILSEKSAPWVEDQAILVSGRITDKDSERKIIANDAAILNLPDATSIMNSFIPPQYVVTNTLPITESGNLYVYVPPQTDQTIYDKLKQILLKYPGEQSVYVVLPGVRGQRIIKADLRVSYADSLTNEVNQLLGPKSVKIN
ncbi:MAG: DNA polymerase III subunit alpha [Patescibacteria group bacterium]|jgi:DNA polymerase-3 subunit alpha